MRTSRKGRSLLEKPARPGLLSRPEAKHISRRKIRIPQTQVAFREDYNPKALCTDTHNRFRLAIKDNSILRTNVTMNGKNVEMIIKGIRFNPKTGRLNRVTNYRIGKKAAFYPETGLYYGVEIEKDGFVSIFPSYNMDVKFPSEREPFHASDMIKKLIGGRL